MRERKNRWASANLVTEHNLREFTFVISLIIYLKYNVPTGRASVKNTVPQSFSALCSVLFYNISTLPISAPLSSGQDRILTAGSASAFFTIFSVN